MRTEELYNGIYCMDCMELLSQIPDGSVSMILTDPPYGISYQNHFTKRKHRVLTGDEGIDYGKGTAGQGKGFRKLTGRRS